MRVLGHALPDTVEILVVDRGPGVPGRRAGADVRAVPAARRHLARRARARSGRRPRPRRGVGGELAAEDTPGGGLTMVLSVPRATPDERPARYKVLVVDDEPALARALAINLRAHGWEVVTAADGRSALEAAASAHPDVVVLDLGLPDMDGIEVIAGLRGWTKVPIVVLSARQHGEDKVEALDLGADDYITKPFAMNELMARLRAAVRRARRPLPRPWTSRSARWSIDLARKRVPATAPTSGSRPRSGTSSSCWPATSAGWYPRADPARGLGPGVRRGEPLPAGLRRPAQAQARGRPRPAAAPGHLARPRLHLGAVAPSPRRRPPGPHPLLHGEGGPAGEHHAQDVEPELGRTARDLGPGPERTGQRDVPGSRDGGDGDEHPDRPPTFAEVSESTPAAAAMRATMNDHLSGE